MTTINYIQFHIGDFLSGTIGMNSSEIGAYIMLICAHFKAGTNGLPADHVYLARIARVGDKSWKKISPRVLEKFRLSDGFYTLSSVVEQIEEIEIKSTKARGNALKRWDKDNANALPSHYNPVTNSQKPKTKNQNPTLERVAFSKNSQENSALPFRAWLTEIRKIDPEVDSDNCPDQFSDEAERLGFGEIAIEEWERFHDYYISQPNDKSVRADWMATWRNWLRRDFTNGKK